MAAVRQLGREDMLFIAGETADVYQHTAGLVILDTANAPHFDFEHLKEAVIGRIKDVPHFRWRLEEVPLALDMPYWVEDENFSYDNHFKRIAVPTPGDREALSEVVAHLYSRHLDRSKPLWEFWFIEGLADGKCAVLQKLHHCMMDGQGIAKLGELLCDLEPNAEARPVDPAIRKAKAGAVPDLFRQSATTALHLSRLPGAISRQVFDMVSPKLLERIGVKQARSRPHVPAPITPFNGEINADRGFVFGSLALDDIKAVRKAFSVSVNDVLLALVSTSLRNYLSYSGDLPEESLRTGIPVSLRTEEDDDISNKVTQAPVTLATNIEDPVERLRTISADCDAAKQMVHSGGKGFIEMIQILPPWMVTAMMAATSPEQTTQMLGSNLIVSNVRGSDHPLYIAGARLETMYPMSIITQGLGVNFTCVSYAGMVDVGVTLAPGLVPDPWEIVDGLDDALTQYKALAAKTVRRRSPARKPRKRNTAKKSMGKRPGDTAKSVSGNNGTKHHKKTPLTESVADSHPSA